MIIRILLNKFNFIYFTYNLIANTQYFQEGINLFKNKKFEEAKFKFEQDIVFNPKMRCPIFICLKYLEI